MWAFESKKPGRSSASSPKTIPMRNTWFSSLELWPNFVYPTCPGRSHVAVVVTISVARRDRGPPRGRGLGPNRSRIVDVSGGGRSGRLARADQSGGGSQGGIGIRFDVQGALS